MNSTNYPGIDYSRGQSNTDTDTSIRYGVICQNSVSGEAVEDVYHGPHSRDLAYEQWIASVKAQVRKAISGGIDCIGQRGSAQLADHLADEAEQWDWLGEQYLSDETDPLYEHDGYKVTKCLNNDLMILKSPFYTYAQYCSPCVPGAGNLDHPFDGPIDDWCREAEEAGFPKVFCLSHDWFEGNLAPYPVFSVTTHEQVHP